jgi:hypothetical protein
VLRGIGIEIEEERDLRSGERKKRLFKNGPAKIVTIVGPTRRNPAAKMSCQRTLSRSMIKRRRA